MSENNCRQFLPIGVPRAGSRCLFKINNYNNEEIQLELKLKKSSEFDKINTPKDLYNTILSSFHKISSGSSQQLEDILIFDYDYFNTLLLKIKGINNGDNIRIFIKISNPSENDIDNGNIEYTLYFSPELSHDIEKCQILLI